MVFRETTSPEQTPVVPSVCAVCSVLPGLSLLEGWGEKEGTSELNLCHLVTSKLVFQMFLDTGTVFCLVYPPDVSAFPKICLLLCFSRITTDLQWKKFWRAL